MRLSIGAKPLGLSGTAGATLSNRLRATAWHLNRTTSRIGQSQRVHAPRKILVDTPAGKVVAFRFAPKAESPRARVVVLHGWGGSAGQLQPVIATLIEAGCEVVAFDRPGHRQSAGKVLSLPTFILVLRRIIAELGPTPRRAQQSSS